MREAKNENNEGQKMRQKIEIRDAQVDDSATILQFIRELAVYEKQGDAVTATVESIAQSLFSPEATAHAILCLRDDKPIGFAVYFYNYSTWLGKNGLYLEDLYVSPHERGTGAGKAMLKYLAQLAVSRNCGRFEWTVLDWNEPAIAFYQAIGAEAQTEWLIYRLSGKALMDFAHSE